ncbi:MAG TPA: hypothetical protein VHC22_00735 [Pirellulales bacterium]|nr:hypothetical protein [Pirellulales bacterium]
MPRPQFSLRTMLWLMALVAAFLGGIFFEKERRWRADQRWDSYWDGSELEYWPMTPEYDRQRGERDRKAIERERARRDHERLSTF